MWIAYHGTSSVFEQDIDETGLQWDANTASKAEVKSVVDIFEKMSWAGNHQGGLSVLRAYSLNHDFANPDTKPIFLAESSVRALTFATHDFAGGETARALRFCFEDLHQYLLSPTLRQEHRSELWSRVTSLFGIPIPHELEILPHTGVRIEHFCALWVFFLANGVPLEALGAQPQQPDLGWLQTELTRHADLERRCVAAHAEHEFGVVYAVKFSESDLASLEYHRTAALTN